MIRARQLVFFASVAIGAGTANVYAQTLKAPAIVAPTIAITSFTTVTAPANPGPSPLASATINWSTQVSAVGFRILRQVGTSPYVSITPFPLVATARSFTANNLAPGAALHFRVVALLSNGTADTAAAASVTTPSVSISTDTLPPITFTMAMPFPPPSSYGFAIMLARQCVGSSSSLLAVWAKNPAATRYRIQVAPGNVPKNGYSKIVADTQVSLPMLTSFSGSYLVYGRPEFAVKDWPASGQTYYQPGNWVYFGDAILPAAAPTICGP